MARFLKQDRNVLSSMEMTYLKFILPNNISIKSAELIAIQLLIIDQKKKKKNYSILTDNRDAIIFIK